MSRPDRGAIWRRFGAPSEQIGSANEPRSSVENGVRFNEKWIHRDRSGRITRVVLWDRYDLVGIFRVDERGALHEEPVPET